MAPFDSTKKKKKKKVVIQDPAEEVDKLTEKAESLTGNAVSDPVTDLSPKAVWFTRHVENLCFDQSA